MKMLRALAAVRQLHTWNFRGKSIQQLVDMAKETHAKARASNSRGVKVRMLWRMEGIGVALGRTDASAGALVGQVPREAYQILSVGIGAGITFSIGPPLENLRKLILALSVPPDCEKFGYEGVGQALSIQHSARFCHLLGLKPLLDAKAWKPIPGVAEESPTNDFPTRQLIGFGRMAYFRGFGIPGAELLIRGKISAEKYGQELADKMVSIAMMGARFAHTMLHYETMGQPGSSYAATLFLERFAGLGE